MLFAIASGLSIGQNDEGLVFGIGTRKNKRVVQAPMATGTWVHLVATWDVNKNEAAIYVDGKLAGAISDLSEGAAMVNGDPRKAENMSVDDIYFEGSDDHGPEK